MTVGALLLVIMLIALIGVVPAWPYSRTWGYFPTGAAGILFVIILALVMAGRI